MFELVGVPYTSMAAPGGIAEASSILRGAGLAQALAARADVRDAGELDLEAGSGERGPSGLLNEWALGRLVEATRAAVSAAIGRERRALLVGGDCPVILGALAAGRDRHARVGLLHVDGHEDAWPPRLSPTGEASDSEVGIALGLVDGPLPSPLPELVPLLAAADVAMLGPRDRAEIEAEGARSLRDDVALFRDVAAVREQGAESAAEAALAAQGDRPFWLHVDLDVLSTADLAAVDYPQPGGLSWDELLAIAGRAIGAPGCLGCSLAIYNPDLDPERTGAERIVRFAADLVSA